MKANRKIREGFIRDRRGFSFIVPLTTAIIVGFALLVIGSYVVGTIGSALEDSFPANDPTGVNSDTYSYSDGTGFITSGLRNATFEGNVDDLNVNNTKFYIYADAHDLDFDLTVNDQMVYIYNNVTAFTGQNVTLEYLIANSSVNLTDTYIWFRWNMTHPHGQITITIDGEYYYTSDYSSDSENKTIYLIGNITDGFSDVVDIEIVVIIITALSMAILSIMAVGSRRQMF